MGAQTERRSKRAAAAAVLLWSAVLLAVSGQAAAAQAGADDKTVLTGGASGEAKGDGAAQFFSQKCSGCHTIGKGNLVGPDLKEAVNWKSDEIAQSIKRMEKFTGPIAGSTIEELTKFLKDEKAQERLKAEEARALAAVSTSEEPASAEVGMKLFMSEQRFENKGMACIACHQIQGQGGTMGKDLTDSVERLGEAALISTCEQPSYPVMKAIYRDHPVTKQEALHITKYLASLKGDTTRREDPPLALWGSGGAALFLVSMLFMYRNRNRGAHERLGRRR